MKRTAILGTLLISAIGSADQTVYTDSLAAKWNNWSWATVDLANTKVVHSGKTSIAVTITSGYQALYLHQTPESSYGLQALSFWINGGPTGGQQLKVQGTIGGTAQVSYNLPTLQKNTWTKITVPLKGLSVAYNPGFDGFWIADPTGKSQPVFYVDDISITSQPSSVTDQTIYGEALTNNWANGSTASINLANTSPVEQGKFSIAVTEAKGTDILRLQHFAEDASPFQSVNFWINGGKTGGQLLQVAASVSGTLQPPVKIPALLKNGWQNIVLPLSALGIQNRGDFDGLVISNQSNANPVATYYVDNLTVSKSPVVNGMSTITVDTAAQTPISPYIYGINSTDFAGMGKGFTFTRMGGNRLSAYNWENNASNAGSDYYFQNDGLMGASNEAGWAGRTFVQATNAGGAAPLVTIPTAGYVAADKNGGGDVRQTPNYLAVRFRQMVAAKPGGKFAYPPDTTDKFVYADEYVHFLQQFSKPNLPIMYDLDNEPDLWSSTHAEIHPKPVTYAELLANNTTFAAAIKNVAPNALVFGFVSYGWEGYHSLQGATDANGRDFLNFYLDGLNKAGAAAKKRLVDVLDLHWYPEATGDSTRIVTDSDSPGLSDARIQAPRSLWDSTYIENSWITSATGGKAIDLLHDTFGRINQYYPGTKLSFSEYYYGGANAISGAIAQADFLGVLGRYGVFAAANWGLNSSDWAILAGFKSFINFDGSGSTFGNQSLKVTGESAATNSVYAAVDKSNPNRVTLVVINKTTGTSPFTIDLTKFTAKTARAFTILEGVYQKPEVASVTINGNSILFSAPPKSVTTIELKS